MKKGRLWLVLLGLACLGCAPIKETNENGEEKAQSLKDALGTSLADYTISEFYWVNNGMTLSLTFRSAEEERQYLEMMDQAEVFGEEAIAMGAGGDAAFLKLEKDNQVLKVSVQGEETRIVEEDPAAKKDRTRLRTKLADDGFLKPIAQALKEVPLWIKITGEFTYLNEFAAGLSNNETAGWVLKRVESTALPMSQTDMTVLLERLSAMGAEMEEPFVFHLLEESQARFWLDGWRYEMNVACEHDKEELLTALLEQTDQVEQALLLAHRDELNFIAENEAVVVYFWDEENSENRRFWLDRETLNRLVEPQYP